MNRDDAEEYTQSLGQICAGSWRQIALAKKLGVPKALNLSTEQWVQERLGGYIKLSIPDRQEAVKDLTAEGHGLREVGDILGVSHQTVANDVKDLTVVENEKNGMAVHYSSETDEWETPQDLFDELDREFGFGLDVCALPSSAKCKRYFTPEKDGLSQKWSGVVWMNPPYGDVISQWVEKARQSADAGATVVCLVPARVDTHWWWDNCRYGEIRFIRGRLKFGNSQSSAPFPSAVVIFGRPASVIWWERP